MERNRQSWPDPGRGDEPAEDAGGIEYLEDRTRPIASRRTGSRFRVSLPGAIAGAFLITALAFGASQLPAAPTSSGGTSEPSAAALDSTAEPAAPGDDSLAGKGGTAPDSGKNTGGGAKFGSDPVADTAKSAESKPKSEPTAKPQPTKAPAPEPAAIPLKIKLDGVKASVNWGACTAPDFWAYKVVRSTDAAATWPMGAGDKLVAVIEDAATLAFRDADVDLGATYTYKVVGFAKSSGEAFVACGTATGRITMPAPKPTPTATPTKPASGGGFSLAVSTADSKVVVDWTACAAPGFDYYKVVRSKDSSVTFPAGTNDTVIAAVGPDGDTIAYEKGLPAGITLYYAVFCVDKTDAGYAVVAATSVKSITTPASAPKPTPKPAPPVATMGFSVESTADGVVLTWEAGPSDGFVYYKVVRAQHGNPSYFPWADGSEVIAVIEQSGTTTFVDHPPAAGTWFYRVQAIGKWDGQKVLLGQTSAQSVAL